MIYIASPFWHKQQSVRDARRQFSIDYSLRLSRRGIANYSPLLYSDKMKKYNTPESFWLQHGIEMVKACDKMIVLCLEGWEKSGGIKGEIEEAKRLNIEIEYIKAGKRLAICGSRSLNSNDVEKFLFEKIEQISPAMVITHGEPEGICNLSQKVCRKLGIPLKLHFLQRRRSAGMFEHRSIAVFNDCDHVLYIHDGESSGCANEKILGEKMKLESEYIVLDNKGEVVFRDDDTLTDDIDSFLENFTVPGMN